jgi:hypothetical protein
MSMLHRTPTRFTVLAFAASLACCAAMAKTEAKAASKAETRAPAPQPLLPSDFAGWQLAAPLTYSAAPEAADGANADLLKEDGFSQFASGTYERNGSNLSVRAMRFTDASGAYAAYTYYRRPGLPKQEVGYGGVFDGVRVLFWQGTIVVDATFDHLTAMSAAELRELAAALPKPQGGAGVPPPLPGYLPQAELDPQSTRYALGPVGYLREGGILPPDLIDFARGAEVITAHYSGRDGDGNLTLIDYPTPQIATDRLRAISTFLAAGNPAPPQAGTPPASSPATSWSSQLAESLPAALQSRRSGPLVAVTNGSFSADHARHLLSGINYSADVTWNHPQGAVSEVSKTARLLIGIMTLTAILGGAAVLLGIFLGGGRALYRRLRGKPASTLADADFISLRLRE